MNADMTTLPPSPTAGRSVLYLPLAVLLALNILPEMIFQLSDRGAFGLPVLLRPLAYTLGAFRSDLMEGIGPVFPGQTLTIFFTYGFLHIGLWHLAVNMLGLVWLGRLILSYRSPETFVTFYLMSMVGAAECVALIQPGGIVVGASGALFGLFGIYAMDQGLFAPRAGGSHPVLAQIARLALATLAVVMSDAVSQILLGSPVAWQAHAGGFVTGALLAQFAPPQQTRRGGV